MAKRKKFNKNGDPIPKQSRQHNHSHIHKPATIKVDMDLKDWYEDSHITVLSDEKVKKDNYDIPLRHMYPDAKFIRNWDELRQIPNESETHILTVDNYSGWLKSKTNKESYDGDHYLSTHTFYGDSPDSNRKLKQYRASTHTLQECGFNVILRGDYGDEDEFEEGLNDEK